MRLLEVRAAAAVAVWGTFVLPACSESGAAYRFDTGLQGGGSDAARSLPVSDAGPPPDAPFMRMSPDAASVSDASTGSPDGSLDRCANRVTQEPVVLYLSADDSNSMASPSIARSWVRAGQMPPSSFYRTYEFLNYYNVRYPFPEQGHVAIVPEMRWDDQAMGVFALQIGVQAAPRPSEPARVITFVLDRSGSMDFGSGPPIAREAEVIRSLAHVLRAGDLVSWVEWNTARMVRLEGYAVSGPDDATLVSLAGSLAANGGTDLDAGLAFGYELAQRFYDPTRLNRVVLISDGIANAGVTSIETIAMHAGDGLRDGIYLVGVGVGDGVNDTLMNAVTDAGRGAYVYVDSFPEAHVLFEQRFAETMDVGLLDVRLELTLPWYMAIREFHGEQYSVGDPTAVEPQSLSPGDAMIYHQTIGACDPALVDLADAVHMRVTYSRPSGTADPSMAAEDSFDTTMGAMLGGDHAALVRGDAIVAYAEALHAISVRQETHGGNAADADARIMQADTRITAALADPANADLAEIRAVFDSARAMY